MHKAKKSKKKAILLSLLTVIVIIVLCVVFFFPINNTIRNATGQDTPSDKLVKDELVKKIKSKGETDPKNAKKIDKYADKLNKTKMSTIMKAANNQEEAAQLIEQSSDLSKSASEKAAKEIFTNDKYQGIRSALSNGDWVQTYQQYQKLSNDGSISQLKQSINQ